MVELKILILYFGAAAITALLYKLIGKELDIEPIQLLVAWLIVPVAILVTKNIWITFALIVLFKIYFLRNDVHKNLMFYLFMFPALPEAYSFPFWEAGNFYIADLNLQFIMGLFVLLPLLPGIWAMNREATEDGQSEIKRKLPWLVLVFALLLIVGAFRERYEFRVTLFSSIRESFVILLVFALPFYVLLKSVRNFRDIENYLGAIALSGIFLGVFAFIEEALRWKVYNELGFYLNAFTPGSIATFYDFRGSLLRVSGSLGHPITFGFYLTIVLASVMYLLRRNSLSIVITLMFVGMFTIAILFTVSRGAMVGLALFWMVLFVYKFHPIARRLMFVMSLVIGVLFVAVGDNLLSTRSVESVTQLDKEGTFNYRLELAKTSVVVMQRHLLFGSRNYKGEPEMQKLVQGQGIVDMVNGYIHIAMEYGLVGLLVFLGLILGAIRTGFRWIAQGEFRGDSRYTYLGATFIAMILSLSVQFAFTSFDGSIVSYLFLGFAVVFASRVVLSQLEADDEGLSSKIETVTESRY
ncbi:MAG: O-antigen ligase family protein [Thiotrichales bacterium]